MHPAFSVIFFTTASGAGYGLLALLGLMAFLQILPANSLFGAVSIGLALLLITAGLFSSAFHLGHPERAWRAMSQWRTSWLSREGLIAIIGYVPALYFAYGWVVQQDNSGLYGLVGLLVAVLSIATVFITSMIYASLKTIRQWSNRWVPPGYILFSLMTGAVLLNALLHWFAIGAINTGVLLVAVGSATLKLRYWKSIDNSEPESTAETATGLGELGSVSLVQSPHTEDNYLLKEMGFQIGRKHARKLRKITLLLAFLLPAIFTLLAFAEITVISTVAVTLAAMSALAGIVVERWLFFAEATHTVTLYYGRSV